MKRILIAAALALPFAAHAFPAPSHDDYRDHTVAQTKTWTKSSIAPAASGTVPMSVSAITYPQGS
jgi:hypothetical protein